MDKAERIKELVGKLNACAMAYYQKNIELMSNYEYDALYDELKKLEEETGIVLSSSPTQNVGHEVVSELPKETHEKPMLSLDKTKSVADLQSFIENQKAVLSWKLDGLTIVLTYNNGELVKAVTRGNGIIGEVVTANAKVFKNVPLRIAYKGELILRGEAVIKYSDFDMINAHISEGEEKYKNPRNLCSGSVRQLDSKITKHRHVYFYAFSLVKADNIDFKNSRAEQFKWLSDQGFDVVEHVMTDSSKLPGDVAWFAEKIQNHDVPSDGLVLLMDDIAYGDSLGMTAKFPRNAIAFKWSDETKDTVLKYIEWSPSRTGLINPVAVFEPVELEGSTVSRASVHNVSICEELMLGEGDVISVYKANMIIPQIAGNKTRSGLKNIPKICPVCGKPTEIKEENKIKTLYCVNPECRVKKVKSYALLASRDALNIDGLSEMTLEKIIGEGFIKSYADIFRLNEFKDEIIQMEGFGEKSYVNLVDALEKAKHTTVDRFIYSLGIPGIGVANAKIIAKYFGDDFEKFRNADINELKKIDKIGEVLAEGIVDFFDNPDNTDEVNKLLDVITLENSDEDVSDIFKGKTFVITGEVYHFKNRKELEDTISKRGGSTSTSVSKNTSYLINNDINSTSSKNKKAKEIGVPVITEEEFLNLL